VWSLSYVPDEPATELENLKAYTAARTIKATPNGVNGHANGHANGSAAPCRGDGAPCLLCSYAHEEVQRGERVVAVDEEGGWVAVVPFWAVWPFETMVLPYKRHIPSLAQMTPAEDEGLARVLKALLVRYDNLFKNPFPYSMGLHQAPLAPEDPDSDPSHAHFHFYPPLLRSASVRKFLVGFEMLGETQRDLTAEQAAARLRDLDDEHYHDIESRAVSRVPSPEGFKPRSSPLRPKEELKEEVRNADRPVPLFKDLGEVYPADGVLREGKRWDTLASNFKERYGAAPSHVVRAPGRVNILGEHVDYSLFPVLPAAIEQDILIALRVRDDNTVRVANTQASFKPAEFTLTHSGKWDAGLVAPKDGGGWENYLKVALLECLERFYPNGGKPAGLDVLITGNVPPGAGLSSSAAMVVSSVLLFLTANNLMDQVTKGDVVAMAIASEHRMGLRTGGMDQAASALSLKGSLLHLSFHPKLDTEPVPLPEGLAVVITNSLAPHSLADSAPERYNLRVVEVLCASRLLLHAWGVDSPRCTQPGEAGRIWLKEAIDMLGRKGTDAELYQHALEALPSVLGAHPEGWTREEMVAASGMSASAFEETYLNFVPVRAERFKLLQRAEHTFAESLRVERFVQLCATGDKAVARELGQLINGSHESLRDLFECTVPEVEALRDVCLKHGALGARQTGGGWGGAVISLLPVEEVPRFLENVKREYAPYARLSEAELEEAAFATLPGVGAGVYTV
jgi:galactokinase